MLLLLLIPFYIAHSSHLLRPLITASLQSVFPLECLSETCVPSNRPETPSNLLSEETHSADFRIENKAEIRKSHRLPGFPLHRVLLNLRLIYSTTVFMYHSKQKAQRDIARKRKAVLIEVIVAQPFFKGKKLRSSTLFWGNNPTYQSLGPQVPVVLMNGDAVKYPPGRAAVDLASLGKKSLESFAQTVGVASMLIMYNNILLIRKGKLRWKGAFSWLWLETLSKNSVFHPCVPKRIYRANSSEPEGTDLYPGPTSHPSSIFPGEAQGPRGNPENSHEY